jgi:uncharacterized protein
VRDNCHNIAAPREIVNQVIQVESQKLDGSSHKAWPAKLLQFKANLLVVEAVFPTSVSHQLLGEIPAGTVSIEYYWLDRWYNIFRFLNATGGLRNYYCNITMPPAFNGKTLSYKDLDLDLVVFPDGSSQILDEAEFNQNALLMGYHSGIKQQAQAALTELLSFIKLRTFPFSDLP